MKSTWTHQCQRFVALLLISPIVLGSCSRKQFETTVFTVTSAGAAIEFENGLLLQFPDGAVSEPVDIRVAEAIPGAISVEGNGARLFSLGYIAPTYKIYPDGVTYDRPISIALPLSRGPKDNELLIPAYWDGTRWIALEGHYDEEIRRYVTETTRHSFVTVLVYASFITAVTATTAMAINNFVQSTERRAGPETNQVVRLLEEIQSDIQGASFGRREPEPVSITTTAPTATDTLISGRPERSEITILDPPTMITPAIGASVEQGPLGFEWTAIHIDDASYELRISETTKPREPLIHYVNIPGSSFDLQSPTGTRRAGVYELEPGGYAWYLVAASEAGAVSLPDRGTFQVFSTAVSIEVGESRLDESQGCRTELAIQGRLTRQMVLLPLLNVVDAQSRSHYGLLPVTGVAHGRIREYDITGLREGEDQWLEWDTSAVSSNPTGLRYQIVVHVWDDRAERTIAEGKGELFAWEALAEPGGAVGQVDTDVSHAADTDSTVESVVQLGGGVEVELEIWQDTEDSGDIHGAATFRLPRSRRRRQDAYPVEIAFSVQTDEHDFSVPILGVVQRMLEEDTRVETSLSLDPSQFGGERLRAVKLAAVVVVDDAAQIAESTPYELQHPSPQSDARTPGNNIAEQANVRFSGIARTSYREYTPDARHTVDGVIKSSYNHWSAANPPAWLAYEFERPQSLDEIVVYGGSETSGGLQYSVECLASEGDDWRTVAPLAWVEEGTTGVSLYEAEDGGNVYRHAIDIDMRVVAVKISINDSHYPQSHLWRTVITEVQIYENEDYP